MNFVSGIKIYFQISKVRGLIRVPANTLFTLITLTSLQAYIAIRPGYGMVEPLPENTGIVNHPALNEISVVFSIRNAGMAVKGTIGGITADISFHPEDLSHSHIIATAEPGTLQTGISIRDEHLQRRDYFDTKSHPQIRLTSKAFRKTGRNKFIGQFDLTIKNITKEITFPFTYTQKQHRALYIGSFEINRLDFNLGEESLVLEEKLEVFIKVTY